jgi:hypothetical protein
MHTDEIDTLLNAGDPANELTAAEQRVVAEMVGRSVPARMRRRYARPIAVGAIAAVLIGGGGMAAAAVTGLWDPWAQNDALATLSYELPSGVSCELRIGNVQGAPDEVDDVIREALSGAQFSAADVAEGAASIGSADTTSDDEAYQTGFNWAVNLRIERALEAHDLDGKWASFSGQAICE